MKPENIQAVFSNYYKINREIRDACYQYAKGDLCIVKEKFFDENGNIVKRLRQFENFKRPFWITKKAKRTHKDKREWAGLDDVDMFTSPQHELSYNVQKALGSFNPDKSMQLRWVNRNPYVYGTDISPTTIIMDRYKHRFNSFSTGDFDVAILDIETSVLTKDEEIILVSLVMGDIGIVYAMENFLIKESLDYRSLFFKRLDESLPQVRGEWGYQVELKVYQDELTMLKEVFDQLHTWKPDIVSGWNVLEFDQKKIAERITELGGDPAYYFSDPEIPEQYKCYKYIPGRKFMVSDSGKKMNLRQVARWHEVVAPASFIWCDAMCIYYQLRKGKGNEPSYSLDAILEKHLKRGKFEIEEASKYKRIAKHAYMQRNHPIYYAIYNLYDSIGVDRLDRKNRDLRSTFLDMLGISDYSSYQSNPKKAVDAIYSSLLHNDEVIVGSTSDKMFNEFDDRLPPLSGWIVALPTTQLADEGYKIIKENKEIVTKFRNHNGDIDIESSYPKTGIYGNVSRMTTEYEIAKIKGRTQAERYTFGLNLMGGRVNAISNADIGFRLPRLHVSEDIFDKTYEKFCEQTTLA